eukprot:scaffold9675_cov56-Phaeocystis_antarctica.AAC.3
MRRPRARDCRRVYHRCQCGAARSRSSAWPGAPAPCRSTAGRAPALDGGRRIQAHPHRHRSAHRAATTPCGRRDRGARCHRPRGDPCHSWPRFPACRRCQGRLRQDTNEDCPRPTPTRRDLIGPLRGGPDCSVAFRTRGHCKHGVKTGNGCAALLVCFVTDICRRPLNNPSRSVRKLVRRWKPFFASSRPALTMHPRRAPRPEPLVPPSTSRVLGAIEAVVVDYLEEWRRDIKCITIADVLSVSPLCSPQEPTPQQAQPRGKSNECARCGVGSIASWRVPPCLCSTCGERFCLGCSRVHECAVAESMAASTSSFCCGWERCMSCKEP